MAQPNNDLHPFGVYPSSHDYDDEAPVDPDFLAQLQKDPSATIQHIKDLYGGRVHRAFNEDLCKHMKWLSQILDEPRKLSRAMRSALVTERLFDELYYNVVLSSDFFNEESVSCTSSPWPELKRYYQHRLL